MAFWDGGIECDEPSFFIRNLQERAKARCNAASNF